MSQLTSKYLLERRGEGGGSSSVVKYRLSQKKLVCFKWRKRGVKEKERLCTNSERHFLKESDVKREMKGDNRCT